MVMAVVAENDPLKSLLNSLQVIGSNFHNLAKNFEHCFNGVVKNEGSSFDDRRKGKFTVDFRQGVEKVNVICWGKKQLQERYGNGSGNGVIRSENHLHFEMVMPFLVNKDSSPLGDSRERVEVGERVVCDEIKPKKLNKGGQDLPFEHMRFLFDQLRDFPKFDVFLHDHRCRDNSKGVGFFANLRFARVGGVPSMKDVGVECSSDEGSRSNEVLRNRFFKSISLKELVELLPKMGRFSREDHPDKKELHSVQDFFRYTEAEGKRLFNELDRDGDGQVTLEDLEIAMTSRNLPRRYAKQLMQRIRSRFFSKSFGWKEFLSVMEQKEPTFIRAYTNLRLSESRRLQKNEILATLENAGLSATEDNATAMMHYLNANDEESKSYAHFRSFMALLPSNQLSKHTRRNSSRRANTTEPPRVEIQTDSVLKTALAGGISCAFSTFLMHPIDTVKTQVQASTTLSFTEILSKLPQVGLRGLYMGSIPAIVGQFLSHGLRTGICEVTKITLINAAPSLPEIQVESVGSFLGTFLGTTMRIPCEVLKQRLQAGQYKHVGEALIGTWQQDGLGGFFRGTGMTLCRELPFYVAGSSLYAESKKAVQKLLGRELEPWEAIVVGGVSGGLTAVMTTPFDVIKTRMMVALQGEPTAMSVVALSILREEGPVGLFRGAVPRFFWVAPLGAINFAGYELIRKAMN